ncbi:hypothetical protein CXF29_00225 [Corynebacterium bovis]|nr:hypothetical protein CXF29_00225 [Corynebacterium bovis]
MTRACRLAGEQALPGPFMVWLRWLQAWVIHWVRPVQVSVTGVRAGRAQQVGEGWLRLSRRMVGVSVAQSWWSWSMNRSS